MAGFFDTPAPDGQPLLSDILGIDKGISIVTEYSLGLTEVAERLRDHNKYTVILAPSNSAIMAMERKPWQDANTSSSLLTASEKEDRASENIASFLKAHIIELETSKWPENEKLKNMNNQAIWHIKQDGGRVIFPGHLQVGSIRKAANGEIWTISQVMASDTMEVIRARRPDL